MQSMLLANPKLCTACNRCALICSATKEGLFQPSKARLVIANFALEGVSAPLVCFQCANPECLAACPEGAISKNESGVVLVDAERCTGCGSCVEACPYGMIRLPEGGAAMKCDLCGGDPACVKECEPGALVYAEPDKDQLKARALQMKERAEGDLEAKWISRGKAIAGA